MARTQAIDQFRKLITANHDNTVVVFNPLNFPTDPTSPLSPVCRAENVENHETMPQEKKCLSQVMPGGQLLFLASDVPSMGYRTYRLVQGTPGRIPMQARTDALENEFYRIQIDDSTGAIARAYGTRNVTLSSLIRNLQFKFNQYLYQRIEAAFSRTPTTYRPRMISKAFSVVLSRWGLTTKVAAVGCRVHRAVSHPLQEFRRIDFVVELEKSESGRLLKQATAQNKEALFYVLPFGIPEFTIHHELPGGVVEPLAHQFQGSTSNYFGIQHFADLSNSRYGVTLATLNAPLVEYGTPRPALWLAPSDAEFVIKKPDRSHVSLYLMNNMFFTNIPLSQPGHATFRWSIRAHDGDWVTGKGIYFCMGDLSSP